MPIDHGSPADTSTSIATSPPTDSVQRVTSRPCSPNTVRESTNRSPPFQTRGQPLLALPVGFVDRLRGWIEHRQHLVIEHQPIAQLPLAVRHHLEMGDAKRPGPEIRAQLEFLGLPPQDQIRLLQHIIRLIRIPQQRQHIRIQPPLTFRHQLHKGGRVSGQMAGHPKSPTDK
jgi:hypothetical protein